MKIIVFSGGADPYTTYKDVYKLLENEANKRGFTEFILKNYPGHFSYDDCSVLSVAGTVKIIHSSILELEKKKEPYLVLCRSYGCHPFVEYLKNKHLNLSYLKKVVLWAPCPYYLWYSYLIKNFEETKNMLEGKDVRITKEWFGEIYPIELSVNEISADFPFNIYITSGTLDNDYSEHFHNLLKGINKNPKISFPERIEGLKHSVTEYNKEYIDLIFE